MTIRQSVIEAVLGALEPLKTSHGVERVERRRSVSNEQKRACAIDVVIGDDVVVRQENLGYVVEFPLNLKVTKKVTGADVFSGLEEIKGAVQDAIETSDNLGGTAMAIAWEGDVEIGAEESVPGVVLVYTVTYRRRAGRSGERY